jgi:hypothetical protein
VIKFVAMTATNLVTLKAAAKRELLFNKPTLGPILTTHHFLLNLQMGSNELERYFKIGWKRFAVTNPSLEF